jgi:hypothetical protein
VHPANSGFETPGHADLLPTAKPACLPVQSHAPLTVACVCLCVCVCCGRVYYYWALQQEKEGYVGADRAYHPPRWQLREMLIRGMHHLL